MVQKQLGNHPLHLVMIEDGSVAITTINTLKVTLIDFVDDLEVVISKGGIVTKTQNCDIVQYLFNTRYYYKQEPNLLKWLKSFNLGMEQTT